MFARSNEKNTHLAAFLESVFVGKGTVKSSSKIILSPLGGVCAKQPLKQNKFGTQSEVEKIVSLLFRLQFRYKHRGQQFKKSVFKQRMVPF